MKQPRLCPRQQSPRYHLFFAVTQPCQQMRGSLMPPENLRGFPCSIQFVDRTTIWLAKNQLKSRCHLASTRQITHHWPSHKDRFSKPCSSPASPRIQRILC